MKSPTVTLTIDGRQLSARAGDYVLDVARAAGIEIPSLCDHPDLEPVAACRVCLVEVTHRDWGGWSGLMTACVYPVSEGLVIFTDSARARRARRGVLSLLAARCPSSARIEALAARHEATVERLQATADEGDACILCGLCARVCETYATGAIVTFDRGAQKQVGSTFDRPPDACVGCGACAAVCPTNNIAAGRTAGGAYQIWRRTFAPVVCTIDEERCIGCGACVEACPFHVARVRVDAAGEALAVIPPGHCRGCGACVGACPAGAIDQPGPRTGWRELVDRLDLGGDS